MPRVKIAHVVSFSSEDGVHKADNLLLADGNKKWRCRQSGEKELSAVLQLEKATRISSIDIGNDGSAFVEVQVGRASDPNSYHTILASSSFMSPVESRNDEQSKRSRVRTFAADSLAKGVCSERWDRVRVVCSQPFNTHTKYGVAFIVLGAPEEEQPAAAPKPDAPKPAQVKKLGAFSLRDDSDESDSIGNLFARKKDETKTDAPARTAAAELRSDKTLASIAVEAISNARTPFQPQAPRARGRDGGNGGDRKRNSNGGAAKKLPRRDGVPGESPPRSPPPSKEKDKEAPPSKKKPKVEASPSPSTGNGKAGPSGTPSRAAAPKPKQPRATRPFNRLLEGVVFTISGYQNPLRAEIRQKAIDMGAKYRPDWDGSCTHLVCAFTNTPKFSQVKGKGKIVKRDWIEKCHADRRRYPWRRLALDPKDARGAESEDEVWEETASTGNTTMTTVPDDDDGLDTDEEIEQLKKKSPEKAKKSPEKIKKTPEKTKKTPEKAKKSPEKAKISPEKGKKTPEKAKKTPQKVEEDDDSLYNAETDEEKEEDSDEAYNADTDVDEDDKSAADDLPDLPDFFAGTTFSVDESVDASKRKQLERHIVTAGGSIRKSPTSDVDILVAGGESSANLKAARKKFPKLCIVKAKFVEECWRKQTRLNTREFEVAKK